jgi:hypothetical protein
MQKTNILKLKTMTGIIISLNHYLTDIKPKSIIINLSKR